MATFIKGMLCPACEKTFLYIEAKNRSFTFQSALNCPHCEKRLQNPEHLRSALLYFKMIILIIVCMAGFFYGLLEYNSASLLVSLPVMFLFLYWIKKVYKLQNGYIPMVELKE